eukprot:2814482-Rhodomonas_salina.1
MSEDSLFVAGPDVEPALIQPSVCPDTALISLSDSASNLDVRIQALIRPAMSGPSVHSTVHIRADTANYMSERALSISRPDAPELSERALSLAVRVICKFGTSLRAPSMSAPALCSSPTPPS